jgi:hypothetical protein
VRTAELSGAGKLFLTARALSEEAPFTVSGSAVVTI